jgi:hypothetical protein
MKRDYKVHVFDCNAVGEPETIFGTIADHFSVSSVIGFSSLWELVNANVTPNTYIIVYNATSLPDAIRHEFYSSINEFNERKLKLTVHDDYISSSLTALTVGDLFLDTPYQYGLRGDVGLWQEFKDHFAKTPLPQNFREVPELITNAGMYLAGVSFYDKATFHVEKYDSGGMSGGVIYSDFWLNEAIPVMVARCMIATGSFKISIVDSREKEVSQFQFNADKVKWTLNCRTLLLLLIIVFVVIIYSLQSLFR